jgi:hypothetical protein
MPPFACPPGQTYNNRIKKCKGRLSLQNLKRSPRRQHRRTLKRRSAPSGRRRASIKSKDRASLKAKVPKITMPKDMGDLHVRKPKPNLLKASERVRRVDIHKVMAERAKKEIEEQRKPHPLAPKKPEDGPKLKFIKGKIVPDDYMFLEETLIELSKLQIHTAYLDIAKNKKYLYIMFSDILKKLEHKIDTITISHHSNGYDFSDPERRKIVVDELKKYIKYFKDNQRSKNVVPLVVQGALFDK